MFCTRGHENLPNSVFCATCGERLSWAQSRSTADDAPPADDVNRDDQVKTDSDPNDHGRATDLERDEVPATSTKAQGGSPTAEMSPPVDTTEGGERSDTRSPGDLDRPSHAGSAVPEGQEDHTLVRLADGSYAATAVVAAAPPSLSESRRRRRRWPWVVAMLILLAAAGAGAFVFLNADDTDEKYLAALEDEGFVGLFPAERAAIAHANALCADFDAGDDVQGYRSDRIAVESYCDEYLDAFEVVPTPEELAADFYAELEEQRLTAQFDGQDDAVREAEQLCARIDGGAEPEGFEAGSIAVKYYCPDYAERFKILERATVTGTFTLINTEYSLYFTPIESFGGLCTGASGFGDINSSTQVVVSSQSGETLSRTELGSGSGSSSSCVFTFSINLTEGEDSYIVAVGDRGEISYSWAEIKAPGAIALSLGD